MSDYEPIDLSAACNMDARYFGDGHAPTTGDVLLRGMPFRIGAPGGMPFVGLGDDEPASSEPVALPIGRCARRLLIAHALFEQSLIREEMPGQVVARYVFVYADGERAETPIRERFEVASWPGQWGIMAFEAAPDLVDRMGPRYEGRFERAGQRQTESDGEWPRDYWIWVWENPRPGAVVDRIEVIPVRSPAGATRRFLVAGVTASDLPEDPLRRLPSVPVRVTLPAEEDAAGPFGVEVAVDRGSVGYTYPLPGQTADGFLADRWTGYGEPLNAQNSPVVADVAALPSATVSVRKGGEELGRANWGQLASERSVDTGRVRFELVEDGRNWVHTTVLDDDTGRPIPCRVHFRSPAGVPYQPHGHHARVNSNMGTWHLDVGGDVRLGQVTYAYIDGKCQGWLPRGEVIVDAARGYEYEPLRTRVQIAPGQRELVLRLKRRHALNLERYFSGDTHVHFLSTQGALLEASGEDLDVVNLLQSQWGSLFTSTEEFTGHPAVSGDGETIVYATQENRQHVLGHLSLLGLKEPVMPWCSDGPGEAEIGGHMESTLSHWADACHAQGGTVVIPHLPYPNGEPAALIATGRTDAVEMLQHSAFGHLEYYRYLNGGYRLPLVGGTDKMDSAVPVGLYRTYAYIPPDEAFTYDNWLKAVRSGRTFLSGGPILRFTVDGQPIGSTVAMSRGGGTLEVEASASSIFPIHTLQIVQGGEVVAAVEEASGAGELRLRAKVKIAGSTWLCARCGGPGYTTVQHFDSWRRGIMAHTSPVYVACGEYDLCDRQTLMYMLTLLDGSLQYIRKRASRPDPGMMTHHHGEADHGAYLERPVQEAIAAVHRKMHRLGIDH